MSMTPQELADKMSTIGITQHQLADRWSMNRKTVSRWLAGDVPVPEWMEDALNGIGRTTKPAPEVPPQQIPAGIPVTVIEDIERAPTSIPEPERAAAKPGKLDYNGNPPPREGYRWVKRSFAWVEEKA